MSIAVKPRIQFIDLAKGVCILLVVLNHSGYNPYPLNLLRMPLYFILSGLFFKDYGGYFVSFVKKLNKLIIPCFFFYLLAFGLTSAICFAVKGPIEIQFWRIFTHKDFHNIYLWFLFSLFWNNMAFLFLKRTLVKDVYILCAVIALVFVGILMTKHNLQLPLFMDSVFYTLPYFFFGYKLRNTQFMTNKDFSMKNILLFVVFLIVTFVGSYAFGERSIDFRLIEYTGNLLLTYITSISFVCLLLTLTKWIGNLPIVSYAGRYSLIILGLHFPIQYVLMLVYKNIGIEPTPLLYFVPTVLIAISCIPFFVRFFSCFVAQSDLIKSESVLKLIGKIKPAK